jgi:dual specificity tyrosine-phosphorylation-regulated kinase 2/3/4
VLGLPYDLSVDMWSLGCIVAELYCGRPIFPGIDENELLEFHILMCGNPPQYMIDKCNKQKKFFKVDEGYRVIRSPNSRLTTLTKNSASLYHALFNEQFP